MARTVGIGIQSFEKLITNHCFYVDKTYFIKEWWENQDDVTLITRPRRFGKTLNMNMLERFFSIQYKDQGQIFEHLWIGKEEKYRRLQGHYPVIFLSFADVKASSMEAAREGIIAIIKEVYRTHSYLLQSDSLDEREKKTYYTFGQSVDRNDIPEEKITDTTLARALKLLMSYMERYYGQKVLIFLDEYDTPMQEAYIYGYWKELTNFIRSMFNSTFKTNPYLERALMTGITRVSKESIFSDLNNLTVVTTTSDAYADCFGFTQQEVEDALTEYGLYEHMHKVKDWYDGFAFGKQRDIYNPWSIINYLKTQRLSCYWANTSSNGLVGKLIREGSPTVKEAMEDLLKGEKLCTEIDEQMIFSQLERNENAIWSLFLASGYLKADGYKTDDELGREEYELTLTNKEVRIMFGKMIKEWFGQSVREYNGFIKALLMGNRKEMNVYMNRIALDTFSYFDTGNRPSGAEPERFYHGFVLGLVVELADRYVITSNRESGFGRYDVMLKPRRKEDNAIILEFKVHDPEEEKDLHDTVKAALAQIETMNYQAALVAEGISENRMKKYGFAFKGKSVLIG